MTARSTEEGMDLGSSQTMVDAGEGSSRLRSLSGATDGESDHRILAAENFNFSTIPGTHYDDVRFLLRNALHRNCGTVWQQATPRTSDLSTVTREFASAIATDMEARLSMAAKRKRSGKSFWDFSYASDRRGKGRDNDYWDEDADSDYWNEGPGNDPRGKGPDTYSQGKGLTGHLLDACATDILE